MLHVLVLELPHVTAVLWELIPGGMNISRGWGFKA